jgi:hypothetical protein
METVEYYWPSFRGGGHLEVSFTLSLIRGNDGRATETRDDSTSAVITTLTGALLEFPRDIDSHGRGQESGNNGEHGKRVCSFQK